MGKLVTAVHAYKAGQLTLDQLAAFVRTFKFADDSVAAGRPMTDPAAYLDVESHALTGIVSDSVLELTHQYDIGVLSAQERSVLSNAIREGHPQK
jgi:hypothetical protein